MTYENIRDYINESLSVLGKQSGRSDILYLNMFKDAIEKQISKPIEMPVENGYRKFQCCNGHNIPSVCKDGNMPYCPFCGQKLDWSE